jgi:aspartate/methionine/tyrosine aminotransferase
VNLARSGVDPCPPALLGRLPGDLVTPSPGSYGHPALLDAIARRYGVERARVFTVSGGASLANWLACAALLGEAHGEAEVIVERPTYESLLAIPRGMGCRVRRLERRFHEGYAVRIEDFARLVNRRTRLAIVTNLHNPSGARIPLAVLKEMAAVLRGVGAHLLVDEVYLECAFSRSTESSVHAGANVVATNSLTKAYGLDGLRAGWLLGPRAVVGKAARIHDVLGVNGVAPGERLAVAAFRRLGVIGRRARAMLRPNLAALRAFLALETRLRALVPEAGNVCFPRLPGRLDGDRFAAHLLSRHDTLVVPGRFFESPRHFRLSFGCEARKLARGLAAIAAALDELS